MPPGTYDVLARFYPKRTPASMNGLRNFRLTLSFFPGGALGAPKCYRLAGGEPPVSPVVHGS